MSASLDQGKWVDWSQFSDYKRWGVLAIFLAWNEFLFALTLTFQRAQTLPVMLANVQTSVGTNWWTISAMVLVTIAPITVISLFLLKYMVKGLILGAIKC